jgi:hypothetical protein
MANRIARWVSIGFDSSVLSLPIFLAIGWLDFQAVGLAWAVMTLIIVTGLPLAYILIGKRMGWVSDFEISQRSERPRFILVSLGSDVLAILLLSVFNGPHLLRLMVLAYLCLGITMMTISSFWKISLHMAGVGGFSTALVFVFGPPAIVAFLSMPLVAWARYQRKKHTLLQLVAGATAGIVITSLVFYCFAGWL